MLETLNDGIIASLFVISYHDTLQLFPFKNFITRNSEFLFDSNNKTQHV